MGLTDEIRAYWDIDARTYDDAPQHRPTSPLVRAAWTEAIASILPPPPAKVLDCGAGTGFLSLLAAGLGHEVTALDLSEGMLSRLEARAAASGLRVRTVVGSASEPPEGDYDAVVERHVLWTLPDPAGALAAWRAAAPGARLVLVESMWGEVDPVERARARVRALLRQLRPTPPEHHAHYSTAMRAALPLSGGTHPDRLCTMVEEAGWPSPRVVRLSDVEWAERVELPLPDRLVGVAPRVVIRAG